mgnify:CR=1 FL=1
MALRLEHLFDQGLAASPQAAALLKSSRGKTRRRVSASRATFAAIRATLQRLVVKDEDKTSMEVKDGDESSTTTKDTIQPSTTSHSITNTQYPSLAIRWEERRQRMTQLTLEEKQMSVREPNESIPASAEEIAALAKELRGLETGMLQRVAARAGVAAGRLDLRSLEPKQQRQLMEELQRVKEEEFLASGSERED